MSMFLRLTLACLALVLPLVVGPDVALGYGGPGSVISGIGAFLALVAALLATLFGFIWFPLKRLFQKLSGTSDQNPDPTTESTG